MKSILISSLALVLFTACSGKKYFEPQETSSNIELNKSSTGSTLKSFNRAGGTLEDGKFVTKAGISTIELPEGFVFLNTTEDGKFIATNYIDKILIGNEERVMKDPIVAASIKDNKLAVVYSNNTMELIDLSSNKTLYKEYLPISLANDTRIANPLFFGNLILFPTLNGRVLIISSATNEQIKNIAVDHENEINNIIELSVIESEQTLIVASPHKIVSISPKEILTKNYKIRDVVVADNNIFLATIDGQLIKLSSSLEEEAKKKYKYAKFHALAYTNSLYAVESQGYLVNINSDFTKDTIYDFSFDNQERMIAIGNTIYYGSKQALLP